jgi:hypothetical protein
MGDQLVIDGERAKPRRFVRNAGVGIAILIPACEGLRGGRTSRPVARNQLERRLLQKDLAVQRDQPLALDGVGHGNVAPARR